MLTVCWENRLDQRRPRIAAHSSSEREREGERGWLESGQSAGVSSVLFYVFLNSFHFACAAYWKIFFLAITRVLAEVLPCNMCVPPRLSLACLPKVILHVVHCSIMFNKPPSVQCFLSLFVCGDVLLKWNSRFFFSLLFLFFHIFCVKCNNLYSWCVLRAASLSHGWCSTTVYWLGLPSSFTPRIC